MKIHSLDLIIQSIYSFPNAIRKYDKNSRKSGVLMRVIVTPIVKMTYRETNDSQDDKFEDKPCT